MERLCAYCGRTEFALDKKEMPMIFSLEHLLPTALIDIIEDNPLTIDCVHKYCNNVAGFFIDAPAIKNWLVHKEIVAHAADFVSIEKNPILPFSYMGKVKGITYEDKICEVWHGPTGDLIYHFHKPYPKEENLPAMVGVPPSIRNKDIDNGFAFLFVISNNPVWHTTIIHSFIKAFKKSTLYSGNVIMPKNSVFTDIPNELLELKGKLGRGKHECEVELSVYGEVRFMAKLALGFGAKLFGNDFIKSEDANLLRKFMWTVDHKDREDIDVHGTRFVNPDGPKNPETKDYFGMDGAHVITIMNLPNDVCLTLYIYNSLTSTIKIGASKEEYKDIIGIGVCYVIVPGMKKIIGPIKQMDFLIHKLNMGSKIPELTEIETELNKYKQKPPFRI